MNSADQMALETYCCPMFLSFTLALAIVPHHTLALDYAKNGLVCGIYIYASSSEKQVVSAK